jgi:hypothetical protein
MSSAGRTPRGRQRRKELRADHRYHSGRTCKCIPAPPNGEAERRAVFSAPNKGTLSRTSTFQRASPRLTRATAPAIVRRRIVRWRKRSRKRPQMRALPHAYVSTLPVRILRRAHTSRASTTMNRPMRRFLTLCCAPGKPQRRSDSAPNDALERRAATERPEVTTRQVFFGFSSEPVPLDRSKR